MKRKKLTTSAIALCLAAVLALGGTFAWQSISQTALNEAGNDINPGGRLHDDFNGENKDVYVENFANEPIFVRVRLQEYLELVMNYGTGAEKTEYVLGAATFTGGETAVGPDGTTSQLPMTKEYHYETYVFDEKNRNEDGAFNAGIAKDGTSYWKWTMGSPDSEPVYYMPTFNLNKDSLLADINGKYKAGTGVLSDRDGNQYEGYHAYSEGETKTGYEILDKDTNSVDELEDLTPEELQSLIDTGTPNAGYGEQDLAAWLEAYSKNIELVEVEHTAEQVAAPTCGLISMADWLMEFGNGHYSDETAESYTHDCWVYDEDGWIYWSAPLQQYETTALLLDGIQLSGVMDDSWYYAINVEAQFVTADDVGKSDNTGFYRYSSEAPSVSAEQLLSLIGVKGLTDADSSEEDDIIVESLAVSTVYPSINLASSGGFVSTSLKFTVNDSTELTGSSAAMNKLTVKVYQGSTDQYTLLCSVNGSDLSYCEAEGEDMPARFVLDMDENGVSSADFAAGESKLLIVATYTNGSETVTSEPCTLTVNKPVLKLTAGGTNTVTLGQNDGVLLEVDGCTYDWDSYGSDTRLHDAFAFAFSENGNALSGLLENENSNDEQEIYRWGGTGDGRANTAYLQTIYGNKCCRLTVEVDGTYVISATVGGTTYSATVIRTTDSGGSEAGGNQRVLLKDSSGNAVTAFNKDDVLLNVEGDPRMDYYITDLTATYTLVMPEGCTVDSVQVGREEGSSFAEGNGFPGWEDVTEASSDISFASDYSTFTFTEQGQKMFACAYYVEFTFTDSTRGDVYFYIGTPSN